ncbi:hypothetical protein PVAND_004997 [Polypedilum vanderplanki]|uniref:Chitin-binding type-2 domain-containing protein n=1 Tax=Polypedilum vanderplanki TaxID=319348 RepID=A0A9J6BYT6_POLVA|nr:hypothetical protein PVAND_004997 [Polypedilum vanderplanki]
MKYILVITLLFNIALSQQNSLPEVNCDDMVAQSGKSYSEIYVPHESDCQRFYQCTNYGLVELKCNKNLVFFPHINGCVVRTKDNCIIWNQWRSLNH